MLPLDTQAINKRVIHPVSSSCLFYRLRRYALLARDRCHVCMAICGLARIQAFGHKAGVPGNYPTVKAPAMKHLSACCDIRK